MPKTDPNTKPETEESIEGLAFEAALARLEAIVQRLEGGDVDLEESIQIYEEGVKLKQLCEAKLSEAQLRVEKIVLGAGGEVTTEPVDLS